MSQCHASLGSINTGLRIDNCSRQPRQHPSLRHPQGRQDTARGRWQIPQVILGTDPTTCHVADPALFHGCKFLEGRKMFSILIYRNCFEALGVLYIYYVVVLNLILFCLDSTRFQPITVAHYVRCRKCSQEFSQLRALGLAHLSVPDHGPL